MPMPTLWWPVWSCWSKNIFAPYIIVLLALNCLYTKPALIVSLLSNVEKDSWLKMALYSLSVNSKTLKILKCGFDESLTFVSSSIKRKLAILFFAHDSIAELP